MEDCPICFLPMPILLISCVTLPSATILSVPVNDFAIANRRVAGEEQKSIIHVAGRIFVKGAFTPSVWLETTASVHFAIPTELTKQIETLLKK